MTLPGFASVLGMLACTLFPFASHAQEAAAKPAGALNAEQAGLFGTARTDFSAERYAEALKTLRTLHAQVPGNEMVAKFGAEAAVNVGDFAFAKELLDPILKASPEDPQALSLQAHLYGQQHDVARRDAALDMLQKLHDSGKTKLASVIVEKVPLPDGGSVTIRDFLEPLGSFHIVLLAQYADSTGKVTHRTAVESDDVDQFSFAKEHPKEAAAGVRMYSMDGYAETRDATGKVIGQTHSTLCPVPNCFMQGRPAYELFRDVVLGTKKAGTTSSTTSPVR